MDGGRPRFIVGLSNFDDRSGSQGVMTPDPFSPSIDLA
jgi:hypothetical protein